MRGVVQRKDSEIDAASALDSVRADCWALMASLLLEPPTRDLLDAMRRAADPSGDEPYPRATRALFAAARVSDLRVLAKAHAALLAAAKGPWIDLCAARWRSREQVASLHGELRSLGLQAHAMGSEPPDHLGSLCRSMSVVAFDGDWAAQRRLAAHVMPWAASALSALRAAAGADSAFYAALPEFVLAFFESESRLLKIMP